MVDCDPVLIINETQLGNSIQIDVTIPSGEENETAEDAANTDACHR